MTLEALLTALSDCLCDEFDDVCACGILPGSQAAIDYCGPCDSDTCGQAWVLLEQVYPSTVFPAQDVAATCATSLAAVVQVGVARCVPSPEADGSPPEQEDLTSAGMRGANDALRARRAVACCMEGEDVLYVVDNWNTGIPSGGCVAGTLRVSVEVTG